MKRRKVYKVAGVYVVAGIGILSAAEVILDPLGLGGLRRYLVILVLLGFPIALVLAWAFEVRPEEPPSADPSEAEPPPVAPTRASPPDQARSGRRSIVVLPFDNMSPDEGDAYLADGLTEEIITHLSYIQSLRVISRNSAMVLKGTQKDTRTIAEELDVEYVLEGSVRKAGKNLRITAQLIDGASDEHLWAERYDGVLEDVFGMQEDVSRSIVSALRVSLDPDEDRRLAERPIEDIQVYELYLMARREMWTGTPEGLEKARRHLEAGLESFGENVTLLQGLAELSLHFYESGVDATEKMLLQAEDLADRITALHPDAAFGHYLKGRIERFRGTSVKAVEHWERALAIDPNHSSSLIFLFHTYSIQLGRPEYASPLRKRVLEHDPLNPISLLSLAWFHWFQGEFDEAASCFERIDLTMGAVDWGDVIETYVLAWQGRRDDALARIQRLIDRDTTGVLNEWGRWNGKVLRGEPIDGDPFSEETRDFLWNDPETVWLAASTFALGGQTEEALNWLEHAVDRGWINYPLLSKNDPLLENIRGEDRFIELADRVKKEWEDVGRRLASA